jgi:hypothetical protein
MKLWFLVIALLVYLFLCLYAGKVALQGTKALLTERANVFERVVNY